MLRLLWLLALIFAGITPLSLLAFATDLRLGDRGADVLALQRLLNQNPLTQVSASGAGSPGNETSYFGPATRQAVIRFQELYRKEILIPSSLLVGTGYVGPATRRKLVELKTAPAAASSVEATAEPAAPKAVSVLAPTVHSISPASVEKGARMVIKGEGFTPKGNRITARFGPAAQIIESVVSLDGKTLEFVFNPPALPTATAAEINSLPPEALAEVKSVLGSYNLTLEQVSADPYQGLRNMEELKADLARKGRSIEDLKDRYIIVVENANGRSNYNVSFKGLRHIQFNQ